MVLADNLTSPEPSRFAKPSARPTTRAKSRPEKTARSRRRPTGAAVRTEFDTSRAAPGRRSKPFCIPAGQSSLTKTPEV